MRSSTTRRPRNINKARRAGVTTERIDLTSPAVREAALAEFFDMHAATGRREDFLVRDREYELNQWRSLGEAGLASLWFASAEGRRRSGAPAAPLRPVRRARSRQAPPTTPTCARTGPITCCTGRSCVGPRRPGSRATTWAAWTRTRSPGCPRTSSHPLWNLYQFKRRLGAVGEVRDSGPRVRPECAPGCALATGPALPMSGTPGPRRPAPGSQRPPSPRHDAWQPRRTLQPARESGRGRRGARGRADHAGNAGPLRLVGG